MSNIPVGADLVIAPPTQATPAAAPAATDYITIADSSDGVPLPQPIIFLTSTTGFAPHGGYVTVESSNGLQSIHYSSVTTNSINGCTFGTGFLSAGTPVVIGTADPIAVTTVTDAQATNFTYTDPSFGVIYGYAILPVATLHVKSTTGFASAGTLTVQTQGGSQTVTYTGKTATTFTGCSGGTPAHSGVQPLSAMTLFQKYITIPGNTPPTVNYTVEQAYPNGEQVTVGPTPPPATTIAVGSNNVSLPQATIYVVSTAPFASSGTVYVATTAGIQAVTYTGITATTFTGCSGGTGVMTTGAQVNLNNGPYWNAVTFSTTNDPGDPGDISHGGTYPSSTPHSWSAHDQDPTGASNFPVGYFVDDNGFCHLRGTVVLPGRFGNPSLQYEYVASANNQFPAYYEFFGTNSVIFTMPSSASPLQNWVAPILNPTGGNGGQPLYVTIQPTISGCQVTWSWGQTYVSVANSNTVVTTLTLDGIIYPVGF